LALAGAVASAVEVHEEEDRAAVVVAAVAVDGDSGR
jgi:hypothetical protein